MLKMLQSVVGKGHLYTLKDKELVGWLEMYKCPLQKTEIYYDPQERAMGVIEGRRKRHFQGMATHVIVDKNVDVVAWPMDFNTYRCVK